MLRTLPLTLALVISALLPGAEPPATPKAPPSATEPATQKGNGYDWAARHAEVLRIKADLNPDVVFIGDSITHHWGGQPEGKLKLGEKVLKTAFADHRVLNLGCGSDRTQNVLWRLRNGEIDGLNPTWVVINIGTNNTSDGNTAEQIAAGVRAVGDEVRQRLPKAKVILMAIFPREVEPTRPRRHLIDAVNALLQPYATQAGFTFLDIGAQFCDPQGNIIKRLLPDACHPQQEGYEIWAKALLGVMKGK